MVAPRQPNNAPARPFARQTLAFDDYGDKGPTVLMLHGIPGSRGTFTLAAERVAATCRVIVPDLLGFGDSAAAPPHSHAKEQAQAVLELLETLAVERVHLVGFDFGGPTAVHLAGMLGRRARSLTLAATNLFTDTDIPLPLRVAKVPLLGAAVFRLAFGTLGLMMLWLVAVGDRRAFPFERYRVALRDNGVRSTRRIFFMSLRDLPRLYAEVERGAAALHLPSVVLWGDEDPFFPVSVGQRTAAVLGAQLRVLPGCGHFVPEERPAELAAELEALVARSEV